MRTHFNSCEHKWLAGQVHVVGRPPCFIKAVKKKKNLSMELSRVGPAVRKFGHGLKVRGEIMSDQWVWNWAPLAWKAGGQSWRPFHACHRFYDWRSESWTNHSLPPVLLFHPPHGRIRGRQFLLIDANGGCSDLEYWAFFPCHVLIH